MPDRFQLKVTTSPGTTVAELRLSDGGGNHLAYNIVDFAALTPTQRRGLFDLRAAIRHYADDGQGEAHVAEVGVWVAEHVLGLEIFEILERPLSERMLEIDLPTASDPNDLAAALARVPWEIARRERDTQTLADRALLVRVVHPSNAASTPLLLGPGESLRVLFVFAEARGARPLDARRERHALLRLFTQHIYPARRVEVDVLSHGVTRERLVQQIQERGGYHIVHWSGHGHRDSLELATPDGTRKYISGAELAALFTEAGGIAREAGLGDKCSARFMRHCCITNMADLGASPTDIQAHARHALISTTEGYLHTRRAPASRAVMARLDRSRGEAVEHPPESKTRSKKSKKSVG